MTKPDTNPFDLLTAVGCRNEQILACMELLSDEWHDQLEQLSAEGHQRDRIYNLWLVLETIRFTVEANDQKFKVAEQLLYAAEVHHQFRQGRAP